MFSDGRVLLQDLTKLDRLSIAAKNMLCDNQYTHNDKEDEQQIQPHRMRQPQRFFSARMEGMRTRQ